MTSFVSEGFVLLGGPVKGERGVLLATCAATEAEVRSRLAEDNWAQNGMLTIRWSEPWTILLDGRGT